LSVPENTTSLGAQWQRSLPAHVRAEAWQSLFDNLSPRFSEPQRHYHTLQHIAECLHEFELTDAPGKTQAVELAIWFHDAIYDPRSPSNEEESALLAMSALSALKVPVSLGQKVGSLILATKSHAPSEDPETALLLDIDLSILGRDPVRYAEYESQIRKEYDWVAPEIFASKRREVRQMFATRTPLFQTEWFFRKFERSAKRNLAGALDLLKSS
jgi:predicted metal-dependent HD superfamily phosphohydrolase